MVFGRRIEGQAEVGKAPFDAEEFQVSRNEGGGDLRPRTEDERVGTGAQGNIPLGLGKNGELIRPLCGKDRQEQ